MLRDLHSHHPQTIVKYFILIYIQQDATLHSLFHLETALHVSGVVPPPIIRSTNNCVTAVFGCRPLRWLSHRSGRQPKKYVKPEAAITVFELLMMGGVSPETCWAIKKHWNNKFFYTVRILLVLSMKFARSRFIDVRGPTWNHETK
jgi:hypothetical protein